MVNNYRGVRGCLNVGKASEFSRMATVQRIPSSTVQSSKEPTASDVLRNPMHPCVHMCVMCVHACLCVCACVCVCAEGQRQGQQKDELGAGYYGQAPRQLVASSLEEPLGSHYLSSSDRWSTEHFRNSPLVHVLSAPAAASLWAATTISQNLPAKGLIWAPWKI